MFYALSWFVVLSLLALWSLAAWALHTITAWTASNVAVLAEGSGVAEGLLMPEWLAPWVSPEFSLALDSTVSAVAPAIEGLLAWAPTLAGGLSVVIWGVWGIGAVLLIVLGFVVTGLIAMLRRRLSLPAMPPTALPAARP